MDSTAIDDDAMYLARGTTIYRWRHGAAAEEKLFSFTPRSPGAFMQAELAVSAEEKRLAAIDYSLIHRWDLNAPPGTAPLATAHIDDVIRRIEFVPKQHGLLVITDKAVFFWEPNRGAEPHQIIQTTSANNVYSARDGEFVLVESPLAGTSAASTCQIVIWSQTARAFGAAAAAPGACSGVKALRSDGSLIVRQTDRDLVVLQESPGSGWPEDHQIETLGTVAKVAFGANGNLLALGTNGAVTLVSLSGPDAFDAASVQIGTENVLRLVFGPGDRWLFSQSESSRIWPTNIADSLALLKSQLERNGLLAPPSLRNDHDQSRETR